MKELNRFRQFLTEGEISENFLARALSNLALSPEKLHDVLDNVVDQLESTIPAEKKEKFDQAVEITREKIDRGAIQKTNQIIAVFKEIFA